MLPLLVGLAAELDIDTFTYAKENHAVRLPLSPTKAEKGWFKWNGRNPDPNHKVWVVYWTLE